MEDRHCGNCTLCCKLVGVEELKKPLNTWCEHCIKTSGCGIYDTRPQSCRDYQCIWLQSQFRDKPLPLAIRPNYSHVVLDPCFGGNGLTVRVDPAYPDAWKRGVVGRLIADVIAKGHDVIIAVGDKRKAFMNRKERKVLSVDVDTQLTKLVIETGDPNPFTKRERDE